MPNLPLQPCTMPGCKNTAKKGRCKQHRAAAERERGSSNQRGYTYRWQKVRKFVLSHNPICEVCRRDGRSTAATEVDHILPKRKGGTDLLSNLQALCKSCHSAKTAKGE